MPTKKLKIDCADIEVAVAKYFKPQIHLIVTNIRDGLFIHECDVLVLNGSNYAVEVEIKISKADIKKDLKKRHGHNSNKIRRLFFAIPEHLYTDNIIALIPERAGIFVVTDPEYVYYKEQGMEHLIQHIIMPQCKLKRNAKINKSARPFTLSERANMGRLGVMRYWNIRNQLNSQNKFSKIEQEKK